MKLHNIKGWLSCIFILTAAVSNAQNNFFKPIAESDIVTNQEKRVTIPQKYKTFSLDLNVMRNFIASLPNQGDVVDRNQTPVLEIPMPNGNTAKFHVWKRSIMEPGLQAELPTFLQVLGQGITDGSAVAVIDVNEFGFHLMVNSTKTGNYFIDPYDLQTTQNYLCYFSKDLNKANAFKRDEVLGFDNFVAANSANKFPAGQCRASQLRKYRLAISCTGEYAKAATGLSSPTVAQAMAKIVTTANRITGVYELEAGITFVLIANNTSIVYVNPNTDPYSGNNNGSTLIGESQTNITNVIGSANFDIGHTFSTGGGGLAGLGVVCNNSQKASGITGLSPTPTGDAYDIDYVAHEVGHQFGGNHTFNSALGSCNGNGVRTPASAAANAEPGSGTTIMAYAGICDADNIGGIHQNPGAVGNQGWSDPQFHAVSLAEIYKYTVTGTGNTCPTLTTSTNTAAPVVNAGIAYTIPISTPFILNGSATDADAADNLTYSWEEIDVAGSFGTWDVTPQVVNIPLFRSFPPKTTGERYFPQIDDVVSSYTTPGERLPTITRAMKFRLTVRDNHAGCGGTCYADATITANTTGGAFTVTYPTDPGILWYEGETKTITWNKAGTASAPFNVANVTIELSTDGGYSFPVTLVASTANDGSESISVPYGNLTFVGRIRVRALGNVFYNMSLNDFTIVQNPVPVKWLSFTGEKVKNNAVKLNWTVNEIDNHHYIIERSLDSKTFSAIGEMPASTQAGNEHKYSFVDAHPFAAKNYYRIKQVDKNGHYSYSSTIMISFDEAVGTWVVFPNPATDKVNLFCNNNYSKLQVSVYDAIGKLVFVQNKERATKGEIITISLDKLAKGAYSIKIEAANAEAVTKKILVQ